MTEAQLKALTLGDIEQITERIGKAAKVLRDFPALLRRRDVEEDEPEAEEAPEADEPAPKGKKRKGRVVLATEEDAEAEARAHRARQFQPVEQSAPRVLAKQTDPRAQLTRAERAEKERLIRARPPVDPNLPEDMQAAEAGDPP